MAQGIAKMARGTYLAYVCWNGMLSRVHNPKNPSYKNYGGRGIDVDPRWLTFETFLADMGEKPAGLTLERVDNDKGYWPDNCVWATQAAQNKNRRRRKDVKLTYEIAEEIRALYLKGATYDYLANQFGVTPIHIRNIVARRTWFTPPG